MTLVELAYLFALLYIGLGVWALTARTLVELHGWMFTGVLALVAILIVVSLA